MKNIKNKIKALCLLCISISLIGCSTTSKATSDKLQVVTTTTMIGDLVNIIGGDNLEVTTLMGPGVDPHLYQASANDVTKLQEADIVVYNGVHLEGKMGDIFGQLEDGDYNVVCLEDGIDEDDLLLTEDGVHDPHIWFSVEIWKQAALHVKDQLCELDSEHAEEYLANYEAYLLELNELDEYINERVSEIPEDQRVLVTAHDAFSYFAEEYGFEVKGIQGISTDAEAGTSDISALADFIVEKQIKAIFIESSVPAKTVESLQAAVSSRGFEVVIGGELYSDSLGDAASGHDTYITTFKANVDTIVNALK